jgi:hypothetical protein
MTAAYLIYGALLSLIGFVAFLVLLKRKALL